MFLLFSFSGDIIGIFPPISRALILRLAFTRLPGVYIPPLTFAMVVFRNLMSTPFLFFFAYGITE